jgi:hypothetical protein
MLSNEEEGRPGDYTETANQKTSHDQATSATDSNVGGGQRHVLPDILRAAAVELAAHHWKVFPLRGKVPLIPNPHPKGSPERAMCKGECGQPGHGIYDATDDVAVVSLLWTHFPASNIGGRIPESMLMIDVDPRHGGLKAWAALEKRYGRFPVCHMTLSGREDGGFHLYVRRPPGRLTARRLGPGIDLKTSTGYAVKPPSIHPETGRPYVGVDGPVPAPPEWFIERVTETPAKPRRRQPNRSRFSSRPAVDALSAGHSWAGVLAPHGWECLDLDPDEDGSRWLHPAATSSCSATIRHGCLFVYSTNTPFEPTEAGNPHGYTKFRAYAVLNHRGDLSAAARALGKRVAR